MMKLIVPMIVVFSAIFVKAGGTDVGNGGDDIAFRFFQYASYAIQKIENHRAHFPEVEVRKLREILNTVSVIVVDEPLGVKKDNIFQNSVAVNYREKNLVVIHRERWLEIRDIRTIRALSLHEILSLAGYESTANYKISQRYLEIIGEYGELVGSSPTKVARGYKVGEFVIRVGSTSDPFNLCHAEITAVQNGKIKVKSMHPKCQQLGWYDTSDFALTRGCNLNICVGDRASEDSDVKFEGLVIAIYPQPNTQRLSHVILYANGAILTVTR